MRRRNAPSWRCCATRGAAGDERVLGAVQPRTHAMLERPTLGEDFAEVREIDGGDS
jgi:hypothetical protein